MPRKLAFFLSIFITSCLSITSTTTALADGVSVVVEEITLMKDVEAKILLLPGGQESKPLLALIESNKDNERFLSVFTMEDKWKRGLQMRLEPELQFFDTARIGSKQRLVAYQHPELLYLNTTSGKFEPLVEIESLFRGSSRKEVNQVDIFKDLNDDGLDDIMISDFSGWQVAFQNSDGSFGTPGSVGPLPVMNIGSERYVAFSAPDTYFLDHDSDGVTDLAFRVNGKFVIHHQKPNGNYSIEPIVFDLGIAGISDNGDLSLSFGDEDDNEENEEKILSSFDDLNGDGIADVLLQAFEVDGLFGTKTRIEIHFGNIDLEGNLTFPAEPDSVILSKGIQFGTNREDIDGNGTPEVMVVSVNFTLGTVLKALIAGSVTLDTGIYQMSDNAFPANPNINRKIKATFDLSSGDISIPAIVLADVTGDGLKDLLVQTGSKKVSIYAGNGTDKIFSTRAISVELELPDWLPGLRDVIQVEDLDGDGRDELVMLVEADAGLGRIVTVRFRDQPSV